MKLKLKPPKVNGRIAVVVAAVIFSFLAVQCEKDPIKGWTFYYEPPPAPKIQSMNSIIKNCEAPFPVTFYQQTDYLLGNVNYFWDFGDGNTSTDKNPNHIYTASGNYTARLIVSNEIGADTAYLPMPDLALTTIPVVADFSYEHFNNNNYAPNKALFTNKTTGANQFYWYFGDGGELNHDNPQYVYQNAGTFTVKLRGTCTNGTFDEVTQQVFVIPPPQRVFIDSINLMLPSIFKSNPIYIEMYHNTIFVGTTRILSPSSYPFKFKRPADFPGGYFFDYVQFTSNEVFKFVILRYNGTEEPPTFLYEIVLASVDIQNKFYPKTYFQLETIPRNPDVFIDLYLSY